MGAQAAMIEARNIVDAVGHPETAFRHKDYADTTIGIYDNFIVGLSARILPPLSVMIAIIRSRSK
jgi:hypothetical protein